MRIKQKTLIILGIILLLFIVSCSTEKKDLKETSAKEISSEQITEKAKIIITEKIDNNQDVVYEKIDIKYETEEQEYKGYFDPALRGSFDWINENIGDEIFLSWWDYGHMIRGYCEKEVVIYSPSADILWSLASGKWNESKSGAFSSKERIYDVAFALTASDLNDTLEIMEKYSTKYIYVTTRDAPASFVLFRIANLEEEEYIDEDYQVKEKAYSTTLFKMLDKEELTGFSLVYSDVIVRIYQLSE